MTEQERITNLETGQNQLQKDLSSLAKQHRELFTQQASLDKSLNKLIIKIDSHFEDAAQYEKNIDIVLRTVQELRIQYAEGPMQRHREMENLLDPVHTAMRGCNSKLAETSIQIKKDIKAEAKQSLGLIWGFMLIICSMGVYIYTTDRVETKAQLTELHSHVRDNTKAISTPP